VSNATVGGPGAIEHWRQLDILDPADIKTPVVLIGCGGIGSPTALALAKMGVPDLELWDADSVEPHNIPNQLYPVEALGRNKAESLAEICASFGGIKAKAHAEHFKEGCQAAGVVISGVDSMEARSQIWAAIKFNGKVSHYVDARMGAQVGQIFTVDPTDAKQVAAYEKTLFRDDEAEEAPCTARAISYNVFALGAFISNQVKKIVKGEALTGRIIIDLQNLILLSE
jgi:hypothetical protein